ncbi:MAG: hypothetical protein WD907_05720 [Bacilli bacterium]
MFDIPTLFSWGPFTIPVPYMIFTIIGIMALSFVYRKGRDLSLPIKDWIDILLTSMLLYIAVWKFSTLLFHPTLLLYNPATILFGNGGSIGMSIGGLVALIYIFITVNRKGIPYFVFTDLLFYWLLITITAYWFIVPDFGKLTSLPWGVSVNDVTYAYHSLNMYRFIVGLSLLIYLSTKKIPFGSGVISIILIVSFGIGLLFISSLQYHSHTYLGLASVQWIYLVMIIFGFLFRYFKKISFK